MTKMVTALGFNHYLHCAHLCKRVYEIDSDVLIHHHKKHTYIAVRGTTLQNWRHNASFWMNGLNVHQGFATYADECIDRYNLKSHVIGTESVTFCGHSAGAAAAALMACYFQDSVKTDLVSFGAPKIGGTDFANEFEDLNIPVVNFVCSSDYVCQLPFACLGYVPTFDSLDTYTFDTSQKGLKSHSMQTYIDFVSNFKKKSS